MYLITDKKTGYLKNVTEPKMVDATHYKFQGKILPFTGPLGTIPDNIRDRINKVSGTMDNTINCSNWWLNYIVFDINDRVMIKMNKFQRAEYQNILKHELKNKHINKMVA